MATLDTIPWTAKNSIFAQLGKFAQIANLTESQRRKYDKDLKIYRDNKNILAYAQKRSREEGRAEGLAEGRAEGLAEGLAEGERQANLETARILKALGKMTIAEIAQATKLTEDEVLKL